MPPSNLLDNTGAELLTPPGTLGVPIVPPNVVESSFDEEDRLEDHPVEDRGPLTHSSFDDEDRIDTHPVP
jgi:hypothetical protein